MPPQTQHRVLAAEPHPLDVDGVGEVPDLLGRVDRVRVGGVHDARVVEHDVHAAPGVHVGDGGRDGGLGRHVAFEGLEAGEGAREDGVDLFEGGGEGGRGDVGHEDRGALAQEEDGCFEADTTGVGVILDAGSDGGWDGNM